MGKLALVLLALSITACGPSAYESSALPPLVAEEEQAPETLKDLGNTKAACQELTSAPNAAIQSTDGTIFSIQGILWGFGPQGDLVELGETIDMLACELVPQDETYSVVMKEKICGWGGFCRYERIER